MRVPIGFGVSNIVSLIAVMLQTTLAQAQDGTKENLRATGCAVSLSEDFGWPKAASALYNLATSNDLGGQRDHAWSIFQAAIVPSVPSDPNSIPVFHTWYGEDETFDGDTINCEERTRKLVFEASTQFLADNSNPIADALQEAGIDSPLRFDPNPVRFQSNIKLEETLAAHATFSHVAFNQELYNYIRDNRFYERNQLLSYSDPDQSRTPLPAPPRRSASLKMGWWPVASSGHSPIPVWDSNPNDRSRAKNPPWQWDRVVAVDASGKNQQISSIEYAGRTFNDPNIVSLDNFYHVTLTAEEARNANDNWRLKRTANAVLNRDLREGDYVVMVALHINTAEYQPWVYTTYWWHDQPNEGKWADGRPSLITSPWNNYLMGAAFNINEPREESDGHAYIVQNPYLELFQKGGEISNCMACHVRSAVHPQGMSAGYDPDSPGTTDPLGLDPIPFGPGDKAFDKGTVFLNTIWTLKTRSN